ncbi:hypothetical protein ACH5RR_001851 [Cinchona calisaya]|uniref:Uncharacterized protein n=1 Tax=Cinchona calisaya TaxID=153742 RepID=A0ABD3B4L3_9GENT
MKRKGTRTPRKEEIAEDWCFVCKDGGNLLLCDYKQCLKAYHSHCVGKDQSFLTSEERWNCNWHSCSLCRKRTSLVHCYCCPKAVCSFCIKPSDLVRVRGKYGFCNNCLKLAVLIEENMDVDSDGEVVDFRDRETYEGLFMEYYKIVREKEGFKIDDILATKDRAKAGKSDSDKDAYDETPSETEDDEEEEEEEEELNPQRRKKELKGKLAVQKNNVKSKRMQFTGWGSTPLIQFLESIGKSTSEKLPERTVEGIINAYIREHKLFHPEKKRTIICDKKLQTVFGRRVVNKRRIYELLEAHYFDNLEKSEEEEEQEEDITYYSEDKDEDAFVASKRRKPKKEKESSKSEAVLSAPQSRFASITAENIKLVYLRRSLVLELSKQPESFENKVLGSFIRVKSDPDDYCQKNSHQLVQVTGITKTSTGENNTEMILQCPNMPLEIHMILLSDADFSLEECEDLRQKVKGGLLEKPTVVELQQKARCLHEDITNHEIARELKFLDERINQANEKGRRREYPSTNQALFYIYVSWACTCELSICLSKKSKCFSTFFEYMERRKLLQTPSERLRLLENCPPVIPEELEPVIEETLHDHKGDDTSPESVVSMNLNCKWGGNGTSRHGHAPYQDEKQNLPELSHPIFANQSASTEKNNKISALEGSPREQLVATEDQCNMTFQRNAEICSSPIPATKQNPGVDAEQTTSRQKQPFVKNAVELSCDDESTSSFAARKHNLEDPHSRIWLISGPNGEKNSRKYSLSLLKSWIDRSSYALKYKAWKENESEEHAIWLGDAVKRAFTSQ